MSTLTPLEVLLFFQSLLTTGVDPSGFQKISDALKENEFVRQSDDYDPARISAEALKDLYLKLLKEEIRNEKEARASPSKDGRKRKLSTPPLQTVDSAVEHAHLLPQLVYRLYARYREHVVEKIQEEEQKYRLLVKDIKEIEGTVEEAPQLEDGSSTSAERVLSIQTLLRHEDQDIAGPPRPGSTGVTAHGRSGCTSLESAGRPHPPSAGPDIAQSPSSAGPRTDRRLPEPGGYHSITSSTTGHQGQYSPHHESFSRPASQSRAADGHGPCLPPLAMNAPSPTNISRRPIPPPAAYGPLPAASPRMPQPRGERPTPSPIILPIIPAMLRSSGSPKGPLDSLLESTGHQYRASSNLHSPRQSQPPGTTQHPPSLPQPRNYVQRSYPYYEGQAGYPPPYPAYGQSPRPSYHTPNQPMPPYSTPSQGYALPGSVPPLQQQQQQQLPPPPGQYGQFQTYSTAQASYPSTPQVLSACSGRATQDISQVTPVMSTPQRRRFQALPEIDTSVSSTRWKGSSRVSKETYRSPTRPDLSPYLPSSPSPEPEIITTRVLSRKRISQDAPASDTKPIQDASDRVVLATRRRGGRGRGSTGRRRGARAVSATSSAIPRSRTRSQSDADDVSISDKHRPSHTIKLEAATPLPPPEEATATPTAESSRRSRRGTLLAASTPPTVWAGKRKRADGPDGTPEPRTPQLPVRPNHVLASRNISRIANPLMHDISTHKLASMFGKPITERDAPGYRELVHQPQDLKSIRGLISAGNRAINAADVAAAEEAAGTPGATSRASTLWLDRSADVMPPKAIVNSAQLEKEICRVFANAVMFNPDPRRGLGPAFRTRAKIAAARERGEDMLQARAWALAEAEAEARDEGGGLVRDTREMFADVEQKVGQWRAAERVSDERAGRREGSEVLETDGDGEGSKTRRRG